MVIAKRIRAYRKYLGFTQDDMATKAGINEKYYGRIERGESSPTVDYMLKICGAMDIEPVELFLFEIEKQDKLFKRNPRVTRSIINGLKHDVDIHFNRDVLIDKCESSIWYNGYVGSMNYDEFELRIFAIGNVKAKLFLNYEEILDLNTGDVSTELIKYIESDDELYKLAEYMSYDEEVLNDKNGNVLFIYENNWLMARLVNNENNEVLIDDIILDSDNIIECMSDIDMLFDYIFS